MRRGCAITAWARMWLEIADPQASAGFVKKGTISCGTNSTDTKRESTQGASAERETGAGDEAHVMSVALDSKAVKTQDSDSEGIAANALKSKRQDVRLKVVAVKV